MLVIELKLIRIQISPYGDIIYQVTSIGQVH